MEGGCSCLSGLFCMTIREAPGYVIGLQPGQKGLSLVMFDSEAALANQAVPGNQCSAAAHLSGRWRHSAFKNSQYLPDF